MVLYACSEQTNECSQAKARHQDCLTSCLFFRVFRCLPLRMSRKVTTLLSLTVASTFVSAGFQPRKMLMPGVGILMAPLCDLASNSLHAYVAQLLSTGCFSWLDEYTGMRIQMWRLRSGPVRCQCLA